MGLTGARSYFNTEGHSRTISARALGRQLACPGEPLTSDTLTGAIMKQREEKLDAFIKHNEKETVTLLTAMNKQTEYVEKTRAAMDSLEILLDKRLSKHLDEARGMRSANIGSQYWLKMFDSDVRIRIWPQSNGSQLVVVEFFPPGRPDNVIMQLSLIHI